MEAVQIFQNKKEYLSLLLLADEEEVMIDRYLDNGDMFVFTEGGSVVGECVVTAEGETCEIKNLAVSPDFQRMGYGRRIVRFVCGHYAGQCRELLVGTGESPATLGFYHRCGFVECGRIRDFFTENYGHVIVEDGVTLRDMILFKRALRQGAEA